jgi:hypothetical protein
LRRGWTKFSRRASAAFALVLVSAAGFAQSDARPGRVNELALAGLRPGRDTFSVALKRYKGKYLSSDSSAGGKQWSDTCTGHTLTLGLDAHGVIQEVTVSSLVPLDGRCENRRVDALNEKDWITGHGLHLGDAQDRIAELYGEPNSSGPSVKGDSELEFLYYAFDWAGSDVPQVMEIYCARDTGRVVEITLASPSL